MVWHQSAIASLAIFGVIAQLEDAGLDIVASVSNMGRECFNLFAIEVTVDVLFFKVSWFAIDDDFVFSRFVFLGKLNLSGLLINDLDTVLLCVHKGIMDPKTRPVYKFENQVKTRGKR